MNLLACSNRECTAANYQKKASLLLSPQILKAMKLTFVFLTAVFLQISAKGVSQTVTLSLKNVPLLKVFQQIEKQTGFGFLVSKKAIKDAARITINAKNVSVNDVLQYCLKGQPLTYSIEENTIVISRKPVEIVIRDVPLSLPPILIKGKITDENGEPLSGATIMEKGTRNASTSDAHGNFEIEVADAKSVLLISYIGYETMEVEANNKKEITIALSLTNKNMNEVVVVGYGNTKKSDLTGSVASVKSKEITAYPSNTVVQSLQGRAAGVLVQANNGNPGGSFKIRIRGGTSVNASSDPIFVIDGFVGANLPPPEDIESMEILKDASATAIYGSRGANGVILVTTKRGKPGKTRIEINSSYSAQKEIKRLSLLNGPQFTDYIKEINPTYTPGNNNTDWQDLIFRNGNILNTQLSFSGGTDAIRYYVSGSFYDQDGIVINSSFRRFSVTSNIDFTATDWLKIGINLFAKSSKNSGVRTQELSGGATGTGVIASAYKFGPDQPVFQPDGSYSIGTVGDPVDNPVALANELKNESEGSLYQYNFYADFSIIKNLKFKTTFGEFSNTQRTGQFTPTTLNAGKNVGGEASIAGQIRKSSINENYLTYSNTFSIKHTVTAVGGMSYQKFINEDFGARSQSFLSNSVSFWNLSGGSVALPGYSILSESQLASYFGRLNYNFSDRYLFTVNARYDGSSNFSKNHKWAFFPSAAIAWNMHNENFMKNNGVISDFKWRLSYGLTGNQAINPYQTLALFSPVISILDGSTVNAVVPTTIANENLKWETTAQLDVGADIGILRNRITITADYYKSVTSDLLFNVPLPQYSGYSSQLKNIGKIENKGFEFAVGSKNFVRKFKWTTDFNISFNRNKVLELPDGNDIIYSSGPGHLVGVGSSQILRVGQPVGSFYGWIYDGVYQSSDSFIPGGGFEQEAGGEKFRDISGKKDANGKPLFEPDGTLNNDDRTIIGNPNPDFIWALNNEFSFKNFDLNFFIQGSQGNDLLSYTLLEADLLSGFGNATEEALKRWSPSNTNTNVPKAFAGRSQRVSSRFVFDGSYIRLKNIALGYNLSDDIIKKLKMQRVRIYLSVQNIATITKYRGYDPEVNYQSSNLNAGLDYGSYPNAKSLTAGINIGF